MLAQASVALCVGDRGDSVAMAALAAWPLHVMLLLDLVVNASHEALALQRLGLLSAH